ncbi:ClpP-like prohead protease/major capsid protein fusion protein [Methylomagnum ishizawai]|uniref:ClpP-like prohead protease/major capsid protein fusion protein n=1 Tax=Methylomagnum ishizawai TaxID=1760988 RepID=UPI001C327D2B|nr:ClpP-like prohead protease/major capsid protein fusion protein [Methylomagnum ishizawai]BBL75583.1 ATP-dependent Clp protease proteolytic subunit [Methylomagnum ishizawai]
MTKPLEVLASGEWWKVKAAADPNTIEIMIYGDIGEDWWNPENSITAKDLVAQTEQFKDRRIKCRINSVGGSVVDGLAIYNAFKRHPGGCDTAVEGVAMSVASLIAMAGETVSVAQNAIMMIHAPWAYVSGNATELRNQADNLDIWAEAMATCYQAKSGQPKETIMGILTDGTDHYYTADKCKTMGFCDEITDPLPVAAALASGFNARFQRPKGRAHPTQGNPMAQENPQTNPPPGPALDPKAIEAQALAKDKARRQGIRDVFARFTGHEGVPALMDACMDDHTVDVPTASAKLLDALGKGAAPANPPGYTPRIETGETDDQKFAKAVGQAVMARCGADKPDPQNELRGYRLIELARASLERKGTKTGHMDPMTLARAALRGVRGQGVSTSDLSVLLENTMHKMVLTGFGQEITTWEIFCKKGTVSDFRQWKRLIPGLIGNLDDVLESGEYRYKSIPDATAESVQAKRKGNIIQLTPETIINDDTGYISDITNLLGRAAKRTVENKVYTLLESNPTLSDGKAVFHADHGNLAASGSAPSMASFEAGRVAMATQTLSNGPDAKITIRPAFWVGSAANSGTARAVNRAEKDPDVAAGNKPNIAMGTFRDIVDTGLLTAGPWYMFADPLVAPAIEVVFLDGMTEPTVVMEEDFDTGGVKYRVEYHHGVAFISAQGAYKNPGP